MALVRIEDDALAGIVAQEILWALKNAGELTDTEKEAFKLTAMFYMTPDEIMSEFGKDAYEEYFNESE